MESDGALALTAGAAFGAAQIIADLSQRRAIIDAAAGAMVAARDLSRETEEETALATRARGGATAR